MKSSSVSPARLSAFEILRRVETGAYASILLSDRTNLSSPDRALRHELVLGVLRHQSFLDSLIDHYANRKAGTLDQPVRVALRLGLYQLRLLSRIPASAAVNESVNLTRVARVRSAEGFVNAVLRRATREADYDPLTDILDPSERLALETSHPQWLIDRWINFFGFDFTSELARANNEPPPMAFRIVSNRADESDVIEQLRAAGGKPGRSEIVDGAWRIEGATDLLLKLAQAGKIYIQDEASQVVGRALKVSPGERVLDLCGAPGGKASQIADLSENRAIVVASDYHEARVRVIAQTAKLHELSSIRPVMLDGLRDLPFQDGEFDAVLVDAPCSGTGTLRHNPEIRWRISAGDIGDLSARQIRLLSNAASVVKRGGRLVYSTCSIEPEENEKIVETFLASHTEFEQSDLDVHPSFLTDSGYARTWPQRDGTDGFFIAAMSRRTN